MPIYVGSKPARVKLVARTSNARVIEENVGIGNIQIIYPGISSCISITACCGVDLVGCHITVSTEKPQVDWLLEQMRLNGASAATKWYVVGKITEFKQKTKDPDIKTRKLIRNLIKQHFRADSEVKFFDTKEISDCDVIAVNRNGDCSFWFRKKTAMWQNADYDRLIGDGLKKITSESLVLR